MAKCITGEDARPRWQIVLGAKPFTADEFAYHVRDLLDRTARRAV